MNAQAAGVQILIADELELIRDGLRLLLTSHAGWEICAEAGDGLDAVEKALHLRPDVVVLDLNAPIIGGMEAARRIRAALPRTEIMLMAHKNNESLKLSSFEAGATGFILKTNVKRQLIAAVESLIKHRPYFPIEFSPTDVSPEPSATAPAAPRLLTRREREILGLVAVGKTSKAIGLELGCSHKTVEVHRASIMKKLELKSISDLVRYAIRNGIVST